MQTVSCRTPSHGITTAQVQLIPKSFESAQQYAAAFRWLTAEDVRAQVEQTCGTIEEQATFPVDICKASSDRRGHDPHMVEYEFQLSKQDSGTRAVPVKERKLLIKPTDIVLLSSQRMGSADDFGRQDLSYSLGVVRGNKRDSAGGETLLLKVSHVRPGREWEENEAGTALGARRAGVRKGQCRRPGCGGEHVHDL